MKDKVKRNKNGQFESQGPDAGFDSETGSDSAWDSHRKRVLKKFGYIDQSDE